MNSDPASYEAWYHTSRGRWIGQREFALLEKLLSPRSGASLLDVGCGTGYFSRRFAATGLQVTGVDPDPAMLAVARQQGTGIGYVEGDAQALPFAAAVYEYASAVTSLCFVPDPQRALQEMWRVARRGVVLGVLNRRSLLYYRKRRGPGYAGARWDDRDRVAAWLRELRPAPARVQFGTAVLLPGGGTLARRLEPWLAPWLPWGGFLAVGLVKSEP